MTPITGKALDKIKKHSKLDGSIEINMLKRPDRENTSWIHIKYDGELPDGREFELVDEYPLLGDLNIAALAQVIGYRVRQFIAEYTKAGEKQ